MGYQKGEQAMSAKEALTSFEKLVRQFKVLSRKDYETTAKALQLLASVEKVGRENIQHTMDKIGNSPYVDQGMGRSHIAVGTLSNAEAAIIVDILDAAVKATQEKPAK